MLSVLAATASITAKTGPMQGVHPNAKAAPMAKAPMRPAGRTSC